MKKNDLSIAVLINSCDAYSDLWEYFFFFFKKYWEDCPYRVYLNTETKHCNQALKNGNVITINSNKEYPWGKRLLHALNNIEETYVIALLEDSFFFDYVRQDLLLECEEMIKSNKSVGAICFDQHMPDSFNLAEQGKQFRLRSNKENYLATAYCTLWKKEYLRNIIRNNDSPWDFELYGTVRASHYKEIQYCVCPRADLVFPFEMKGNSGCGVSSGKWTKGNVELFKKHGLVCDFEKRGFIDLNKQNAEYAEWLAKQRKLTFKEKVLMPFVDYKKFKEKITPKLKTLMAKIDISGRVKNLFI